MVPLGRDIFVERELLPDERERIARAYATAMAEVARRLAPLEGPLPLAIFCRTDRCGMFFGGTARRSWTLSPGDRLPGAKYVAGPRLTILILRVDESVGNVIAHETVHGEVDFRLHHARVPLWFHEGLAAFVSDEPRCTGREGRGIDDLRRLERNAAWAEYTSTKGTFAPTYCQARAEVDAWLHRFGKPALLDLLDKVRDGGSFEALYGPLQTQGSGPMATVLVSSAPRLGDRERPFSLAMWIKPIARTGVLAHVSETPVGTGWCVPFLGFDRQGRLVSQIFYGDGPDLTSFAVAVDTTPRALDKWTHVAMTWAPGSGNRLYVDGVLAGETNAPRYNAPRSSPSMYVAWGTSNVGGETCWTGAVTRAPFQGAVTGTRIYDVELGAAEVAALARASP